MPLFFVKRLLTLIATLLGASAVIFMVLEILPGNAAQMLMGPDADPQAVLALTRQLGLDHPPLQRYGAWLGGLLTGQLGDSYVYSTPVLELVLERLALTVPLALMAMALTTVLALLVGVYAASRHNRAGDVGLMAVTQVGIAIRVTLIQAGNGQYADRTTLEAKHAAREAVRETLLKRGALGLSDVAGASYEPEPAYDVAAADRGHRVSRQRFRYLTTARRALPS